MAQQHSTDAHADPVERLTQRGWRGEIGRAEADLPSYLWHLFEQVDRHAVGRIEVNPETVERNECVVGESAAPDGGGGFASIASNSLSNRHNFPDEAGDLGHRQPQFSASTPLV